MSFLWLLLPVGVVVVAVLVGRRLTAHRPAPGDVAPEAARPGRRLVASVVNWASTIAVGIALGRASVSFGQAMLAAPLCVFAASSLGGTGPGELAAWTHVVDATSGHRLALPRGLVRVVVQLVSAYAVALSGWVVGLGVAAGITAVTGSWNPGVALLGAFVGALIALVTAEPMFVRITPQRTTPWDAAASSAVVPRRGRCT